MENICKGLENFGISNKGSYNKGNYNKGDYNKGDYNKGDCNKGDCNQGYDNIGDYNKGKFNIGYCNKGIGNIGMFCTDSKTRIFNKECDLSTMEIAQMKGYDIMMSLVCRSPKDANKEWELMDNDEKQEVTKLPNFDEEIFKEITGIKKFF